MGPITQIGYEFHSEEPLSNQVRSTLLDLIDSAAHEPLVQVMIKYRITYVWYKVVGTNSSLSVAYRIVKDPFRIQIHKTAPGIDFVSTYFPSPLERFRTRIFRL